MPLSETTSIPVCFIWECPPLPLSGYETQDPGRFKFKNLIGNDDVAFIVFSTLSAGGNYGGREWPLKVGSQIKKSISKVTILNWKSIAKLKT